MVVDCGVGRRGGWDLESAEPSDDKLEAGGVGSALELGSWSEPRGKVAGRRSRGRPRLKNEFIGARQIFPPSAANLIYRSWCSLHHLGPCNKTKCADVSMNSKGMERE